MKKRIVSLLIILSMLLSFVSVMAFASESDESLEDTEFVYHLHQYKDGKCEICGQEEITNEFISGPIKIQYYAPNHSICKDNANGFERITINVRNFFRKMIGAPQLCYCGFVPVEFVPPEGSVEIAPGVYEMEWDKTEILYVVIDHSQCESSGIKRAMNGTADFFRRLFGGTEKCVCGDEI